MAQQRIKFVRNQNGGLDPTTEADATSLDANEKFRLIVDDALPATEWTDAVQALIHALSDQQLVRAAALA